MTTKLLTTLVLALLHTAANAQNVDANAAIEESSPFGAIVFGIVTLVSCIVFAWFVWRNDKKQKELKELGEKESQVEQK